jgi:putative Mn2+ efflux pump MntP
MPLWTVLLIALGVSADAFAVAVTQGLRMRRLQLRPAVLIAATFGVFQAGMPLLGYLVGRELAGYIEEVDHWIAFGLLALVGVRMIRQALTSEDDDDTRFVLTRRELLVLAVATSIDALAVGISFALIDIDVVQAVLLIGLTTFVLSFGGVVLGQRAGARFRRPAEVLGGVILLVIGARILVEHLATR